MMAARKLGQEERRARAKKKKFVVVKTGKYRCWLGSGWKRKNWDWKGRREEGLA